MSASPSSSTAAASTAAVKKGPTDYSKWSRFNPKDYGYDSEEERSAQQEDAMRRDPRFHEEQARQYKATIAEMDRTRKRIAELEKQQKEAEAAMATARTSQDWWSTWGVAILVLVALLAMAIPQIVIYYMRWHL